ncbi:MAG TPA: hypothetical protein VGK48_19225 [Terriglobia bacterium]|jgi:hypothetical protein
MSADRRADGFEYLLIAGESDPALLSDQLIPDPNGELARFPEDRLSVDAEFILK